MLETYTTPFTAPPFRVQTVSPEGKGDGELFTGIDSLADPINVGRFARLMENRLSVVSVRL